MMVSFSGGCVDLLTVNLELIVFFYMDRHLTIFGVPM